MDFPFIGDGSLRVGLRIIVGVVREALSFYNRGFSLVGLGPALGAEAAHVRIPMLVLLGDFMVSVQFNRLVK
jgi:hypothetical protein